MSEQKPEGGSNETIGWASIVGSVIVAALRVVGSFLERAPAMQRRRDRRVQRKERRVRVRRRGERLAGNGYAPRRGLRSGRGSTRGSEKRHDKYTQIPLELG